ncbi:MAG: DUF192 domain-containing protein [Candidatus Palauibacterales bacterium]|nr:DUF192 domain-containing protein [Candidatus Palauibacterales bacterium]MDP2583636.1 DUF192 domain-containing protein [Candidatus Palauibacterales bacterium]
MKLVTVTNRARGAQLGHRVEVADGFWTRLRGLLGRKGLDTGGGLLLTPCRGVHMMGMRFALDVLLLDGGRRVVGMYRDLAPGKRTRLHGEARHALELPAGTIERTGTREGDELTW